MKCPKCDNEMVLKSSDFSFNEKSKPIKKYKRLIYWCEVDDVWVQIEEPSKTDSK